MSGMETVELQPGKQMPLLGLGTWQSAHEDVKHAVYTAITQGYRHIDCASRYNNEKAVGEGIKQALEDKSLGLKREDLWVTSKLWQTNMHEPRAAIEQTLADLQLPYLDLYLIHWPVTNNEGPTVDPPLEHVWHWMEQLCNDGITRAIGVSNFSTKKIQDLLTHARVPPAVNQVELHVGFKNERQLQFCKKNGIHVSAYSPLGGQTGTGDNPIEYTEVADIAQAHGCTKGQVMLAYVYQKGASVLPKTVKAERIKENMDALRIKLSEDEMEKLDSVKQKRLISGKMWLHPEKGPYKVSNFTVVIGLLSYLVT